MNVDPKDVAGERLDREVEGALAELNEEAMARIASAKPTHARADERGRIPGRIVAIRGGDVFVDVGGKAEAFVPLDEFDSHHQPEIGQNFEFIMHGFDSESGLMRLSLREVRTGGELAHVKAGDVIEGRVTGLNIGGLELQIGALRGFLPKSQVELARVEDFGHYIGKRLECEVTEVDRRGKNLVLSRRRILEKQRAEARQQLVSQLEEGQTREGVVARLTDFGAFVDLGGIEGLLHVSDLSYARVRAPADVLKVGDKVQVKILKIDLEKDRISLGMKQLAADPWDLAEANYRAGQQCDGKIVKLMDFGAFVELQPGIEGLIPVSEMSWTQRVRHPRDVVKEGDSVRVSILSVDNTQRRISLSLKALSTDPWQGVTERYPPDSVVSGLVMRTSEFGAFIQLEEGVEGLAHISELSDQRVRKVDDVAKPGQVVKVRIKSVDPDQRRISLSLRGTTEAPKSEPSAAAPASPASPPPKPRKRPELRGGLTY
ncbi:MAG: S1 RNA-binding domain-containing protein [Phycisphaerae bacterium]